MLSKFSDVNYNPCTTHMYTKVFQTNKDYILELLELWAIKTTLLFQQQCNQLTQHACMKKQINGNQNHVTQSTNSHLAQKIWFSMNYHVSNMNFLQILLNLFSLYHYVKLNRALVQILAFSSSLLQKYYLEPQNFQVGQPVPFCNTLALAIHRVLI